MVTSSILCQMNGGCMGCCGHYFPSNKAILIAIKKNTNEFNEIKDKNKENLISFRDRFYTMNLRDGVCRNLIDNGKTFLCPLHPTLNGGEDLRLGHCDTNFLCKTAKKFEKMDEKLKKMFLEFIKTKNLDNVNYSIEMDNGKLLKEFKDCLK